MVQANLLHESPHGPHQGWCAGRFRSSSGSPRSLLGVPRDKHMTRRAFHAKQCSESNSAAGESARLTVWRHSAQVFPERILCSRSGAALGSVCVGLGSDRHSPELQGVPELTVPLPALGEPTRAGIACFCALRVAALPALTGLMRWTLLQQRSLTRGAPRGAPGQAHDS